MRICLWTASLMVMLATGAVAAETASTTAAKPAADVESLLSA